ncbi:PilZ domain-containing protein [Rhodopseudomonas faecalis]|uniref:PilZ domain-containing protein n=1 Tax=Rhodopseudomonas faecalis TaxID=99655 RepID=A0A318TG78_9BRAD|nr:PilZ domain-containing protein [Rhodopseudomonas faecalis]PYF03523.1 PilZ domain-containing protein [Rhodopseudomonas faecalis]TAH69040.1 MAG: PilZ domain-containing protein [Rhodopseudomonas palustris]
MTPIRKKREPRKSVRQEAWITLEGGFAARPCTVLDLSPSGAKIVVEAPQALNSKLRLAFSRDARSGRNCEVVWREGKMAGLKFTR